MYFSQSESSKWSSVFVFNQPHRPRKTLTRTKQTAKYKNIRKESNFCPLAPGPVSPLFASRRAIRAHSAPPAAPGRSTSPVGRSHGSSTASPRRNRTNPPRNGHLGTCGGVGRKLCGLLPPRKRPNPALMASPRWSLTHRGAGTGLRSKLWSSPAWVL